MMDHRLEDEIALEAGEIGLPLDEEGDGTLPRAQPGTAAGNRGMARRTDASVGDPAAHGHVVRAEAIVLVHHEAHAVADIVDQLLRLGHRLRHRLLQHDMDAMVGCEPCHGHMRIDGSSIVHDLEAAVCKQRPWIVVDPPDAELCCPRLGLRAVDVAHRHHLDAGIVPCPEVIEADHAGADQSDAYRAVAIWSDRVHAARSVKSPPR